MCESVYRNQLINFIFIIIFIRNFEEFLEKEKISTIVENLEKIDYFRKSQENLNPFADFEVMNEEGTIKKEKKMFVSDMKEHEEGNIMKEEGGRMKEEEKCILREENEESKTKDENKNEKDSSRIEKEASRKEEEVRIREEMEEEEQIRDQEGGEDGKSEEGGEDGKSDRKKKIEEKVTFERFEEALQKIQIEDMKKDITAKHIVFDINIDEKLETLKTTQEKEQVRSKPKKK